jgi:hypothetical protein
MRRGNACGSTTTITRRDIIGTWKNVKNHTEFVDERQLGADFLADASRLARAIK